MRSAATAPVFTGKLYDHEDARRRVPNAWRLKVEQIRLGDGSLMEREHWENVAPKGLGHFERDADGKYWVYVQPNGLAYRVSGNWGKDVPPPLPRPKSEWRKCGCSKGEHVCTVCGEPYWLEVHGFADGCCTFCYARG